MHLRKSHAGLFIIQASFFTQLHLQNYVQQKKQCNQTIKPRGELCCLVSLLLLWWSYLQKDPKLPHVPAFQSFESMVRSFSAGEISLPPPLSDIPGNMYQTCNTLFDATSRHWEGDWKMRQSQDSVRLCLRFLDIWWNTEWCVWYSFKTDKQFLKTWKVKGAMSPVAHALASENKLEKDGPSFSSSVGDFGRLFLAVEISAIVR